MTGIISGASLTGRQRFNITSGALGADGQLEAGQWSSVHVGSRQIGASGYFSSSYTFFRSRLDILGHNLQNYMNVYISHGDTAWDWTSAASGSVHLGAFWCSNDVWNYYGINTMRLSQYYQGFLFSKYSGSTQVRAHSGYIGGTPAFYWEYGANLSGFAYSNGVRYISASWSSAGADAYAIYFDGTYQGNTGALSWGTTVASGSHRIGVYPLHNGSLNGGYTGTASGAGSDFNVTISAGTPSTAGTALVGNVLKRKTIRVTLPAVGTHASNTLWDIAVNNAANTTTVTTVNSVGGGNTDVTIPVASNESSYYVYYRARWADGDLSSWALIGNVTAPHPVITGSSATTSLDRAMTVTWNQITDMTSYDIALDALAAVNIPQTPSTTGGGSVPSSSVTYTYTVGASGTTCSVTFSNIKGTSHSAVITPKQTGYTDIVTIGNASGGAVIPVPAAPTAVGEPTVLKRQLRVTAPSTMGSGLPANFFNASSWDARATGDDTTIGNTTGATRTLSGVQSGTRTAQIRARWADGDVSAWSPVSNSIVVVSPPPSTLISQQKSAPPAPSVTPSGTGGTLNADDYVIAVSINKNASKSTDPAHPDTTRYVNETTPSGLTDTSIATTSGSITVTKPTDCTGGDTWNVYIGTDRNVLRRGKNGSSFLENIASSTASVVITTFDVESNKAKIGKVDLLWNVPSGVGDNPLSYKVERVPMNGTDPLTGTPGTNWLDTSTRDVSFRGQFGLGPIKYWEDNIDTGYYFYRVYAVYNNDTSSPADVVV